MPSSKTKKKQRAIGRRYKRLDTRGFKDAKYWTSDTAGRLSRTKRDKSGRTHEQAAIKRHYEDYLDRPYKVKPTANKPVGSYRKGGLGPTSIFTIILDGGFSSALHGGNKKDKGIYMTMLREMKQYYRRVVREMEIEVVGDPRTLGGSKGLVPRGGVDICVI